VAKPTKPPTAKAAPRPVIHVVEAGEVQIRGDTGPEARERVASLEAEIAILKQRAQPAQRLPRKEEDKVLELSCEKLVLMERATFLTRGKINESELAKRLQTEFPHYTKKTLRLRIADVRWNRGYGWGESPPATAGKDAKKEQKT
jgi:hypothetical protein